MYPVILTPLRALLLFSVITLFAHIVRLSRAAIFVQSREFFVTAAVEEGEEEEGSNPQLLPLLMAPHRAASSHWANSNKFDGNCPKLESELLALFINEQTHERGTEWYLVDR